MIEAHSDPPTLLLVEDDQDDVLLIQRAVRKARLDCQLQTVADGEKAVAYLSGAPPFAAREQHPLPALLLLDLKLPRKSGLEVLEWLRAQAGIRRMPVVVLTSSRESSDVTRAYDLGANSYLVKPVSFDALHEMLRALGMYWLELNEQPPLEEPA